MSIFVECPHCRGIVEILQINCGIFRHGIFKQNGQQLDPHLPKHVCDMVYSNGLILGCGKPFRLVQGQVGYFTVDCGYI